MLITLLGFLLSSVSGVMIGGRFPVWALALCGGLLLAVIVAMTTRSDRRPSAHFVSILSPKQHSVIKLNSSWSGRKCPSAAEKLPVK